MFDAFTCEASSTALVLGILRAAMFPRFQRRRREAGGGRREAGGGRREAGLLCRDITAASSPAERRGGLTRG